MTNERPWFVVQIIPRYSLLHDGLDKVCLLGDRYREELENLAGESPHFFVHYADQGARPPVYFKFSCKNPSNKQEFEKWVDEHKNDEGVESIELNNDQDHLAYNEAADARKKIFEPAMRYVKSDQIKKLKKFLRNSKIYMGLKPEYGRHFFLNSLKIFEPHLHSDLQNMSLNSKQND